MRTRNGSRLWLALASVAVAVCTTPTAPCACEPNRTHIRIYGVANDEFGAPVAGASIFVIIPHIGIGAPINDPVLSPDHTTATTAADGAYRVDLISLESPSTFPVGVLAAAVRAPADTVRLAGAGGHLRPIGQQPDSIEVNFVFP